MTESEVLIQVRNLKKYFPVRRGLIAQLFSREKIFVKAVDDVSFDVRKNEVFVIAGESGCGKTTTGRTILNLTPPTEGSITYSGRDLAAISKQEMKALRPKMQIIFQDPYESLNPRLSIFDSIAEGLQVNRLSDSKQELIERVKMAMEDVRLIPPEEFIYRFPHMLSGGQRQRVVISRAIVTQPEFIVADEPVSMLDASIRAEILQLLKELIKKYDLTYIYITHDLASARYVGDRIAIMYLGKIVEYGPVGLVIDNPKHQYTAILVSAVPIPDPTLVHTRRAPIGEVPSPINPPSGCRFHTRCPKADEKCRLEEPPFKEVEKDHFTACWHWFDPKQWEDEK
ncbi:MAG: ABC transporter ATP-binding protein [Candidatus Hermodarchaeota archaeon]|nr:ABC transporter ATP-binding protein [Candidatus Hermodarchaeota archaeon]